MITYLFQGGDLCAGCALATRDDGAGVAHAAAGRSGHAGDEGDDWLGVRTLRWYFMKEKVMI